MLPPESVSPDTVMVCPETPTVPAEAVVKPLAEPVVLGALQPVGTASVTAPSFRPPVAAVYVKVIVFPVDPAETLVVGVVRVPVPFAALTVMLGEELRLVRVPPDVDLSWACHVCGPVLDVAVAPDPPPEVTPYEMVNVEPAPGAL